MGRRHLQIPPNCEVTLGMTCIDKTQPGRTVWRMLADERFANPIEVIQGGFIGAMAGVVIARASSSYLFTPLE